VVKKDTLVEDLNLIVEGALAELAVRDEHLRLRSGNLPAA